MIKKRINTEKWLFATLIFAFFFLSGVVSAPAAAAAEEQVRLALIPGEGERKPPSEPLTLMEVELFDMDEIALLEREQVNLVLAEHDLTAAGLTDPRTAVRIGHLLEVDMFLFIEGVPETDPPVCRVQAIDALTGVARQSTLWGETDSRYDTAPVVRMLHRAVAQHGIPVGDRHYVGLLGFINEEPGQLLDSLASTLHMQFASDVMASPNLVLLDREHLQWLRQERELTDVERDLKTSTVLIEGGLRRSGAEGMVELRLRLAPLDGGEPDMITLSFDRDMVREFREELVAAVAEHMELEPLRSEPADPVAEGEAFLELAKFLRKCGEKEAALRAAEAAYTIWPSRGTRMELVFAYNNVMLDGLHHRSGSRQGVSGARDYHEATAEEQVRSLRHEVQMLRVLCEYFRSEMVPWNDEPVGSFHSGEFGFRERVLIKRYPGLGIETEHTEGEAARLRGESAALRRELFDTIAEAARRDPERFGNVYWKALNRASVSLQLSSIGEGEFSFARRQAEGLKEIFRLWDLEDAQKDLRARRNFRETLLSEIGSLETLRQPDAAPVRELFASVFESFEDDPVPIIRAMALYGHVVIDADAVESAERLLVCLKNDLPPDIFSRRNLNVMPLAAFKLLEANQKYSLAKRLGDELMEGVLEEGSGPWALLRRMPLVKKWGRMAEKAEGKGGADAVYERVIAFLENAIKRLPEGRRDRLKEKIRTVQSWQGKTIPEPVCEQSDRFEYDPDNPWNRYDIEPLGLKLPEAVRAAFIHGDRLYCLVVPRRSDSLTVSVHRFPEGGPALRTGTVSHDRGFGQRLSPAFIGDQLYIGTIRGLLTWPGNGDLCLLTEEEGLPGTSIRAVTAYDDKLYLSLGGGNKSGFGAYNPSTGAGRIIFSSTAVTSERRRDMQIEQIVHDEKRNCLWLLGTGLLYRYDPAADKLWPRGRSRNISLRAIYCHDGFLYGRLYAKFTDLDTFEERKLLAISKPDGKGAVFGTKVQNRSASGGGYIHDPIWFDGTILITYTRIRDSAGRAVPALVMYREGENPAVIESPDLYQPYRGPFHDTPHGLFVFDNEGEGYLIRKTGD